MNELENVITEAIKNQNLRLAAMKPEVRTKDMINILSIDDLHTFKMDKNEDEFFQKKTIGFKNQTQGAS